jgi:hypothetical protein
MALDPSVFEKLGVFYLGRSYDLEKKASGDPCSMIRGIWSPTPYVWE